MIHLIIREPVSYQKTLCQALNESYEGRFFAWFGSRSDEEATFEKTQHFKQAFLPDVGYRKLFLALRADREAVVILGGWSSGIAYKTLLITTFLRVPVFIWADHPHPRKRNGLFARLRRFYLRLIARWLATGILACGNPTVEHLIDLGIAREKIINFPYWVELPDSWSPPATCRIESRNSESLRLLAVGRHVREKAFDVAIKALASINEKAGEKLAELVVVGDGPERQFLEDLAASLKCGSAIRFTGRLSNC